MLVPAWYPTNSQNLDGESQTRVLDFCQAAVTGWQPGFLQMCLILIDKVGSQMCSNLGSWNWVSSWQTCRYVFLSDFWWNFLSIAVVDLRLISVKQCKNICPWLQSDQWKLFLETGQTFFTVNSQKVASRPFVPFMPALGACLGAAAAWRQGPESDIKQSFGFWCFKVANRMPDGRPSTLWCLGAAAASWNRAAFASRQGAGAHWQSLASILSELLHLHWTDDSKSQWWHLSQTVFWFLVLQSEQLESGKQDAVQITGSVLHQFACQLEWMQEVKHFLAFPHPFPVAKCQTSGCC